MPTQASTTSGLRYIFHQHKANTMHQPRFDPTYVQVSKPEAAEILGLSIEELEDRRRSDNRCPQGFVDRENWMTPMRFRLSDVYTYSEIIMKYSKPASTDPQIYKP